MVSDTWGMTSEVLWPQTHAQRTRVPKKKDMAKGQDL